MQSSNPMNFPFTLAPMGSQQFYNMAQDHAMVNSAYPVPAPAYVPCTEDAGYRPAPYYHPASSVNTSSNLPMNAVYVPSHDHSGWNWPCDSLPVHLSMEAVDTNDFIHAAHEAMSPRRFDGISPRGLNTGFGIYESLPQNVPASAPVQAASDAASHEVENISDDALPDGYKWRKYGQKQVKGSVYPRNYYKCTIPGCSAKRHLEKFFDAHLNKERLRTIYLGEHVHPTPVSPHLFVTNQQDFRSNVFTQSNKIRQMSQEAAWDRVKGEATDAERLVVECLAHVDENEDGYFWRKYGQKTVKGSFAPRQYYRCRNADCRVKKQVEASPAGNTVVTYEGVHNHEPGDCPDNVSSHSDYQQVSYTDDLTKVVDLPPVSNRAKREYVESSYPHMDSPSSSISTTEDDGSSVSSDVPSSNKRIKYEESDPVLHYLCELPPSKEELVWDCSSFGHHDLNPRYVTEFFLETIAQE